ncbi:MAG TPA: helix-turn-helix domain-containing protein [Saprospiraceae bacterium]|jgi:hypothetical protein|nr:helix-turn-helix domain-containing protein [Saprospiraceae bacterium]
MPAEILTTDDLREFKLEIILEIKKILNDHHALKSSGKRFLKSNELQELLDLSPASLQNLRNARVLPYTKIGGTYFYDWEDVVQLMNKLKKPSKAKV